MMDGPMRVHFSFLACVLITCCLAPLVSLQKIPSKTYSFNTTKITIPSTGGSGGTTTLSYVDSGPRGAGPDRTILGLHGYTDSWNTYRLIMKKLPQYRFISLSLPCFGDSSKDPSYDSYEKQAGAVVAFLDKLGIARVHVIGHSMSSVMAQYLSFSYPTRVNRVVLLGSAVDWAALDFITGLAAEVAAFKTTYNITADDPLPASYVDSWQRSTTTSATPQWFLNSVISETLKVPVKCWEAGMKVLLSGNVTTAISRISAPVLTIRGVDDFLPLNQSFIQAQQIQDYLFDKVTGAGHAPHWERAEYTAAAIDTFLRTWPVLRA